MAVECLLSVNFLTPICCQKPQLQGPHTWGFTGRNITNQTARKTGPFSFRCDGKKYLLHKNYGGRLMSLNRICHCSSSYAPKRTCTEREPVLCDSSFSIGDHMISGFWIGPDIDDGWGFVEAFVTRNY